MRVLVVLAHPEPQSLNVALSKVIAEELQTGGHEVQVSDLYAMGWKSNIDRADFPTFPKDKPLAIAKASQLAYTAAHLTEDVMAEQKKLLWADTVILQFPLWWFSMPAILKGYVDRVWSCGFAYGVGEHSDKRYGDRYGEGVFAGKRAMLVVTAGGWESHYSARGINGPIDDLLWPINHGILYYPGFTVLPAFVAFRVDRYDKAAFDATADRLRERIRTLSATDPIPFRPQNMGDYEIPAMVLRDDIQSEGQEGFKLHQAPSSEKQL
ncbi:hypothetical protein PV08_07888 [Exophiala spinifera]|uniref:Flavodoxin-like fold domain-containing protein n=1 Tax=Exophiala spinifera TaxID=91928 RepID=A0A0D1YJG1_9EURO|nr:uncharacterized protein PV08_07888 [Exophiala spinifera]KIW15101.1 hypothetical protein PV08_07888 [Exophiala spinifera]